MSIYCYQHEVATGAIGEIQLARPKACNAVNEYMSQRLYYVLEQWLQQANIQLIIIRGLGDHFCAGADLPTLLSQQQIEPGSKDDFILRQYKIIQMLRQASKPILALASGAICGFGAGIFMAAKHRVIAVEVAFSMPECAIGFFPDVGAAKFLQQLPENLVTQMLNTGQPISGDHLVQAGIVDQVISQSELISYVAKTVQSGGALDLRSTQMAASEVIAINRSPAPTSKAYAELLMLKAAKISYSELLVYEYALARHLITSADFSEGISAFMAKRSADWQEQASLVDLETLKEKHGFFA